MSNSNTAITNGASLPPFLCQLSHLSAISLSGEQRVDYLQGQVSADISALSDSTTLLGCHCDAKGKTLSVFNTVLWENAIVMIMHEGGFQASFDALKKFGVFAKTDIIDKSQDLLFVGGKGQETESLIIDVFGKLPAPQQVVSNEAGVVIHVTKPETRFLIILSRNALDSLSIDEQQISAPNGLWQLMDIQAGIPHIESNTVAEFIPQMMNLQALDAISFTKGCYMGQETVARNKYLGKNKRASFILMTDRNVNVNSGDVLERQVGENWRRGGTVLSSSAHNTETWLLAVLPNDTDANELLRLKEQPDVQFVVKPLPYPIEE